MTVNDGEWPMPERLILTGGTIVTPTDLLEAGSVVIEGEQIVAVTPRTYRTGAGTDETVRDVTGQFVLPGIVCLHNDAVEKAINPRPSANFPTDLALMALDRALISVGVTTQFHALAFIGTEGNERATAATAPLAEAITAFQGSLLGLIDHHVLYRFDVRSPEAFETVCQYLRTARVKLIAFTDPMLGQGLPRDAARTYEQLRPEVRDTLSLARWQEQRTAYLEETTPQIPQMYEAAARFVRETDAILMSHDDETPEKVDAMHALGCRIAEFPLTAAAARRAHERGMPVSMGAANLVRGGSLSGNARVLDLIAEGLVDILVADYHAPSLLRGAFLVAERGFMPLPAAIAMITATPARAVGLRDRGALEAGRRADVIVVDASGAVPAVTQAIGTGTQSYQVAQRGVNPELQSM